jgi:hypothetical protein
MHPTHPDETQVHKIYLWTICLVATLGGFLFGYDWVAVGGAKEFHEAPSFPLRKHLVMRWSFFRWPTTGSIAGHLPLRLRCFFL